MNDSFTSHTYHAHSLLTVTQEGSFPFGTMDIQYATDTISHTPKEIVTLSWDKRDCDIAKWCSYLFAVDLACVNNLLGKVTLLLAEFAVVAHKQDQQVCMSITTVMRLHSETIGQWKQTLRPYVSYLVSLETKLDSCFPPCTVQHPDLTTRFMLSTLYSSTLWSYGVGKFMMLRLWV